MSPEKIRLDGAVRDVRLLEGLGEDPLATLLERAFEQGRAVGIEEGRVAGRGDTAEILDTVTACMDAAQAEALEALGRTSVELAIEISRALLRREIRAGNYDLEAIVRQTLEEAAVGRGPCVVHLNPSDRERLRDVQFRTGTRIEADEGVAVGDVHVETPLGLLVRETFSALESIEKRLQEELS